MVRLTDRPDMTLDVYRGRKTTMQQQQQKLFHPKFMISAMTDFYMVNFPFLDGDVPRSTSYNVYISQLIRFARVSSHVSDFNAGVVGWCDGAG